MFYCVWTFIDYCILIVSLCDCHTHSIKATYLLTYLLIKFNNQNVQNETGSSSGSLHPSTTDSDNDSRPLDRVREAGSRQQLDRRRRRGDVPTPSSVNDVQRLTSQRRKSSGPYRRRKRPRQDTVTVGDDN